MQRFSHRAHANGTDAQPMLYPDKGCRSFGAVGKWPAGATIKGRAQAGHLPTAGSAEGEWPKACMEGPVSCALMSGLLRGTCRWPSWVCACVLGANLCSVLKAHEVFRLGLKLP